MIFDLALEGSLGAGFPPCLGAASDGPSGRTTIPGDPRGGRTNRLHAQGDPPRLGRHDRLDGSEGSVVGHGPVRHPSLGRGRKR